MKMSVVSWSSRKILIAIFLLALALRVLAVGVVGERKLADEFGILVPNLLAGDGYSYYSVDNEGEISEKLNKNSPKALPSAYMPPGYPFFLAGICYIIGTGVSTIIFIEMLQALLGAITCIILYTIVEMKFDRKIAFASCIIFCVYPILVFMSSQISAVSLYIFLNCVLILLLFKGEETEKMSWFAYAGLIFGVLILSRGQVLLYFPFILGWIYFIRRDSACRNILIFALATIIIIGPWAVRNYHQFGRITPLTISGGLNLWQGQNENATGTRQEYTNPPVKISEEMSSKIKALQPSEDYEVKLDRIYMDEAISFMRNNPSKVIKLALQKFMFYWGYYWRINFVYPGAKSPLYWLPWFILLPFFIVGTVITAKKFREYSLFYLYFILSTGILMIFFVIPRYRLFILPLVIPFSVKGAFFIRDFLSKKHRKPQNVVHKVPQKSYTGP